MGAAAVLDWAPDAAPCVVRAGLESFGATRDRGVDADPRQPWHDRTIWLSRLVLGAAGQTRLGSDVAFRTAGALHWNLEGDADAGEAEISLGVLYSPAAWISFGPGVGVTEAAEFESTDTSFRRHGAIHVGQALTDGAFPAALIAFHPSAWVDLGLGPTRELR